MIKVKTNSIFGDTASEYEYPDIESLLEDFVDDSVIRNWLNDIYDTIDIPIIGKVAVGDLLYSLREQGYEVFWEGLVGDYIMSEVEYIEDELTSDGEMEWNGYLIQNTDFGMEGNDA